MSSYQLIHYLCIIYVLHYLSPGPPAAITFTEFNIDVKLKRFLAIWSVPFSHMNHSISSYNVSVINLNTTEVYQRTITVSSEDNIMCSAVNDTLDFPSLTNACDIINVTVIAINDIGSSEPTSASLYIPTGIYYTNIMNMIIIVIIIFSSRNGYFCHNCHILSFKWNPCNYARY